MNPDPALLAELAGAGEFTRRGLHQPLLASLQRSIPPDHLRRLSSLVFVLLKPDAVVSGKVPAALDFFERHGLEIAELAVCHRTSPRQFEELYKYNLAKYAEEDRPASWWLNGQLYAMAPVVALLVRCPPHLPAHQTIAALKGPSNPHRGEPGQLRYELGACNRSINLVHTADDPLSTAREYLIFHSRARLAAALAAPAALAASAASAGPLPPWRDRYPLVTFGVCRGAAPVDFVGSLVALKLALRALDPAAELSPGDPADAVSAVHRELVQLAASAGPPRRRLQRYRELCRLERAALGDAAPRSRWAAALRELTDFESYDLELAQRVHALLVGEGVWLDPWDRLVVETGMYYLDDFLCSADGGHPRSKACNLQVAADIHG